LKLEWSIEVSGFKPVVPLTFSAAARPTRGASYMGAGGKARQRMLRPKDRARECWKENEKGRWLSSGVDVVFYTAAAGPCTRLARCEGQTGVLR
jgi:hypothetical protein